MTNVATSAKALRPRTLPLDHFLPRMHQLADRDKPGSAPRSLTGDVPIWVRAGGESAPGEASHRARAECAEANPGGPRPAGDADRCGRGRRPVRG